MSATLAAEAPSVPTTSAWRCHLEALAVTTGAILLLFWSDAAGMAAIWWNSSTYNHCLLIPPLIGWLVWQRRPELLRLAPVIWLPGLLLAAAGAFIWLLGHAAGLALGRHLGLVLILQTAVMTLLGRDVARGLAFPIFFAIFLLPFGEELVPAMQTLTAELAMGLLNLTGIPAHLEGVFITTRAGYFEVAEACAGAKFLIAMVALGALVANVCFRSWRRRIAFMAASVIVPLLANGVRAWGTIYIAEGSGIEFASSFDHVIYGGVFFAAVIAVILAVAWPFFDRRIGDPWLDPRLLGHAANGTTPGSLRRAGGLLVALAASPLLWAQLIAATGQQDVSSQFLMPEPAGWTQVTSSGRPWEPYLRAPTRCGRPRSATGRARRSRSPSQFTRASRKGGSWSASARARSDPIRPGRGPPTRRRPRTGGRSASSATAKCARLSVSTASAIA